LRFIDTHDFPDVKGDKLVPDVSIYSSKNEPEGDTRTDFSKMDIFVELKAALGSDPFCDPNDLSPPTDSKKHKFGRDSKEAKLVRGQLASYAATQAGRQFRVHIFSVLVCGIYARLFRWDRAGAIVTQRFNYTTQPHFLAGFFWRYHRLGPCDRGYDTSVLSWKLLKQSSSSKANCKTTTHTIVNSV
jgi:hypothetical protein